MQEVAPSTFGHWMRPKENPDGGNLRGEVYGLLAVRPMVEDQKADEKGDRDSRRLSDGFRFS